MQPSYILILLTCLNYAIQNNFNQLPKISHFSHLSTLVNYKLLHKKCFSVISHLDLSLYSLFMITFNEILNGVLQNIFEFIFHINSEKLLISNSMILSNITLSLIKTKIHSTIQTQWLVMKIDWTSINTNKMKPEHNSSREIK